MKTLTLLVILLLASLGASGQTSIYIGAGPNLHPDAPFWSGNLTIGVCSQTGNTCEVTDFQGRQAEPKSREMVYSTSTGLRQVIKSTDNGRVHADLFLLAQGGVVVTTQAAGLSGAPGGGITLRRSTSAWSFTVAGQMVYSPVNATTPTDTKWKPLIGWRVGYTFR